jgi:hypothetical protein
MSIQDDPANIIDALDRFRSDLLANSTTSPIAGRIAVLCTLLDKMSDQEFQWLLEYINRAVRGRLLSRTPWI